MQSFKKFMLETYEPTELKEINDHGCAHCAPGGMIYYHETIALHDKYEDELWETIARNAEDCGQGFFEYVSSCQGKYQTECPQQFKNWIVWYCAESFAQDFVCRAEDAGIDIATMTEEDIKKMYEGEP